MDSNKYYIMSDKEKVEAIKRGEKYEEMWKKFQHQQKYCFHESNYREHYSLTQLMHDFEQKYFPEPKDELVELVKKIDKEVRELLNLLGG